MSQILKDLEKITEFSQGKINDPRSQLTVCQNCLLKESFYSVSFYTQNLHYLSKRPVIMFISRDPNIKESEIRNAGNIFDTVKRWKPRKHGVGWFFNDFLVSNGLWEEFLNYLENGSLIPRFYWTHLIKCYAQNDKTKVDLAIPYCTKYLWEEIKEIKPKLIICAGIDVAKTIINNFDLKVIGKERGAIVTDFRDLIYYHKTTLNKRDGIVGIYHPSGIPYQQWKKGELDIGISFEELKKLINEMVSNFNIS